MTTFGIATSICFFVAIIIALCSKHYLEKFFIPYPLFLVGFGYLVSELMVKNGIDTGIRASNFSLISHYFFVPIILFSTSFKLNHEILVKEYKSLLIFALPIPVISFFIIAISIFYSINHPSGFPWLASFISAAILVNVSAQPAVRVLSRFHVSKKLEHIHGGESVISDVFALILFSLFIHIALKGEANTAIKEHVFYFFYEILGGSLVGSVFAYFAYLSLKITPSDIVKTLLTIFWVYLAFIVADDLFEVSAAVSIFILGVVLGRQKSTCSSEFLHEFWKMCLLVAGMALFFLVGITFNTHMFTERYVAILFAIAAIVIARGGSIYGIFRLLKAFKVTNLLSKKEQHIMNLASIRGAFAIALALSIPTALDYWWTIQSIIFGIVLFTLVIELPLLTLVLFKEASSVEKTE
jgi:Na+:H+ antiporter